MLLRMKHVYTLQGPLRASIGEMHFPALKEAVEGHFEGLTVELGIDGEIRWNTEIPVDPDSTEGIRLAAWFQGWLCGFFVSHREGR